MFTSQYNPGQIQLHIQLQLWLSSYCNFTNGCKKCFYNCKDVDLQSLSLTHTHRLSLSISLCLLSFCHNKQSAICCVCCASAAFKCSNHKMSLEQLYSYFTALSYNAPVSLSSSLPVSFSLLHFPSLSCFADCFRRSVCLFVFGVQKKFPNMRLKLNVKMCRACSCVCSCVCE